MSDSYGQPGGREDPVSPGRPDLRWPVELWYWGTPQVAFSQNRSVLITNSPAAAGLFYGARAFGNAAARKKARRLAQQQQWLVAGSGEMVLDDRGMTLTGTWGGTWASMRIDYAEVVSWERDQDALRIVPVDYYPLLLRTPHADNFAGWYAHLSHGKLWQPLGVETWEPPPQVPVKAWEQRDKRFTCAIPDGWEPFTDSVYLANAAKDAANNQQRLLFMLHRNPSECHAAVDFNEVVNPEIARLLSADPAHIEQDALRFAGVKAERANGVVVTRPRVILMGGERATMIDTTMNLPHIHVRLRELYVGRRGRWYMVGLAVAHPGDPQPLFDRYSPEFQAMIATWQWRDLAWRDLARSLAGVHGMRAGNSPAPARSAPIRHSGAVAPPSANSHCLAAVK